MYKIEFLIKQATRYCHILPGHIDSLNLIPAPFVSLVCISSILDRRLSTFHRTNRINFFEMHSICHYNSPGQNQTDTPSAQ